MKNLTIKNIKKQLGVTAMEYGVIAAVTIIAIVGALAVIGPNMTTIFTQIGTALTT